MKKIQVVLENGTYTCDTGLSVSDWKNILQDLTLVNVERLDMLTKFYNEPGHKSTCKAIAEKYDKETVSAPQKYNSLNTQLGKSICKKYSISFKSVDNGGDCFWIVAMTGRELDNNRFEWELRPEVVEAMESVCKLPLLVYNIEQIRHNCQTVESYLSDENHRDFIIERIHRGKTFLVYNVGNELHFSPSRFMGYVNNSHEKYDAGIHGDGKKTNSRFRILFGCDEIEDDVLCEKLEKYCLSLGTKAIDGEHTFFMTNINLQAPVLDDYQRFKKLLEYFVAYLEYCYHNPKTEPEKKTDTKGFAEYIRPILLNGVSRSGQGWKGHSIQFPITQWDKYYDYQIVIAADARDYTTARNYLTWNTTAYNIIARWGDGEITALTRVSQNVPDGYITGTVSLYEDVSIKDLGLFDNQYPNEALKLFYINYYKKIDYTIYQELQSKMKAEKYINILEKNHNMVFTGAPGSGKTYLAKTIAQAMNAKFEMVQFHPSYDYTDFVEGLRPTPPDNNGNIGFKRTSGVFWKFCEMALKSKNVDGIDNFEDSWTALVGTLNDDTKDFVDIPMISGKNTFRVELNEYGTGLATRTYENDEPDKGNWIKGKSKFFSKDQLYNVYRGMKGIPSGGHDNYRKAIIAEMKKSFGLKDYKQGLETQTPEKYVFIIDEINRGELSKIFGELFFSIDPGYRGIQGAVKTQYSNMHESDNAFDEVLHSLPNAANFPGSGWFFVPDNVYIIGTMNDIDRSVESMDFALRRRFRWCEISAEEMQDEIGLSDIAKQRMDNLNKAIVSEEIGLSSSYCIGASYFKDINTPKDLEELWDLRLSGLLYEYFRGMDDSNEKLSILEKHITAKKHEISN